MPTRAVTILSLVQIFLLIVTWMLATKFTGLLEQYASGGPESVPDFLRQLRAYGLFLLAAPLGVALLCTKLTRTHRNIAVLGRGGLYPALLATVVVAGFALLVAWLCYAIYTFGPTRG